MARTKADGKMTKADAVRAALAAGVDMPAEGSAHIKEKYGLVVTPQQFSTAYSRRFFSSTRSTSGGAAVQAFIWS